MKTLPSNLDIARENERARFSRYALSTLAVQFVLLVVSAGTMILTSRVLGPEGRGVLTVLLLVPTLAVTFGKLGMGQALVYQYNASAAERHRVVWNGLLLSILLSLALTALAFGAAQAFRTSLFKGVPDELVALSVTAVTLGFLAEYSSAAMQASYRIGRRNALTLFQPLAFGVTLVWLYLHGVLKVTEAMVAWTVALAATAGLGLLLMAPELPRRRHAVDPALMGRLITFGSKAHVGNVLKQLTYRCDILILGYFTGEWAVGIYYVAVALAEVAWRVPDALGVVLFPRIARATTDDERRVTPVICRLGLAATAVVTVSLVLGGESLIVIMFGPAFRPSAGLLIWLAPGVLALAVWKIVVNDLLARGHATLYTVTCGVGFLSMAASDLFLIPTIGEVGAAVGSSVGYCAASAVAVVGYGRITGYPLRQLIVLRREDWTLAVDACRDFAASLVAHRGAVQAQRPEATAPASPASGAP